MGRISRRVAVLSADAVAPPAAPPQNGRDDIPATRIPPIQHSLPLFDLLVREFGADEFDCLRKWLEKLPWAIRDDGQTEFFHALARRDGLRVDAKEFAEYDRAVSDVCRLLNKRRARPFVPTYFQYLCLLFFERFLRRLTTNKAALLADLNAVVNDWNARHHARTRRANEGMAHFVEGDLMKAAFWMATGSGKTLLMHAHIHQWRRLAKPTEQNGGILLLTPGDALSRQHLQEFADSGIAAVGYGEGSAGLLAGGESPVTVVEITKLTDRKTGGGKSVDVLEFSPYGLILVDEGHRGASGDKWLALRKQLGENALTLEYSATFGQVVNGASAAKKPDLWATYSHAILFDYAYRRFYRDGYGKDFFLFNVDDANQHADHWPLVGNLLAFYRQVKTYEANPSAFAPYQIPPPLWVFVGNTVTGGKGQSEDDLTDIETCVRFFADFLRDADTAIDRLRRACGGQTGIARADSLDLFATMFADLLPPYADTAALYADIVRRVFHGQTGATLSAVLLKNAPGEIALLAGSDAPPFAVINVGDADTVGKRIAARGGVAVQDDAQRAGLFATISRPGSPVQVLIGSRRFMEGWNSFRVSCLGLLNIGTGEGSQIIQLFGRGVRLMGKNASLKRTTDAERTTAPPGIVNLETLNVYGVRANYLAEFRKTLHNEGLDTNTVEVTIPIAPMNGWEAHGLKQIRTVGDFDEPVTLDVEKLPSFALDMRPKIEQQRGLADPTGDGKAWEYDEARVLRAALNLLDWQTITCEMLRWRQEKGAHNLALTTPDLRAILQSPKYRVLCAPGYLSRPHLRTRTTLHQTALAVLKKAATLLYDRRKKDWETRHMAVVPLLPTDLNLEATAYTIKIALPDPTKNPDGHRAACALVEQARALAAVGSELLAGDVADFPNVHFDRHLYLPLLTKSDKIASMTPPGLEESEAKFVRDLRDHLHQNAGAFADARVFLLRNQARGRGIGFFDNADGEAFYPDFLLWILKADKQYLSFLDPHGIRNDGALQSAKYTLFARFRDEFQPTMDAAGESPRVVLNAFVLVPATFADFGPNHFPPGDDEPALAARHILFQDNPTYMGTLLAMILRSG